MYSVGKTGTNEPQFIRNTELLFILHLLQAQLLRLRISYAAWDRRAHAANAVWAIRNPTILQLITRGFGHRVSDVSTQLRLTRTNTCAYLTCNAFDTGCIGGRHEDEDEEEKENSFTLLWWGRSRELARR